MTRNVNSKSSSMLAETVGTDDYPETTEAVRDSDYEPYLSGEVIGDRYRLQQQIGRGGMGVVWVAHSLVLGIDVALKLIRAGSAGPAVASRMAREAHAAARLGHPALVRVFDFGWTSRGDPFLVMELIHGDTLASVIRRDKKLPAIRAVQTILPIVDGLRVAHERSIVHRDIKPDNIVLSADALGRSQPKLLDFGIAKVGQRAGSAGKITQMGAVLGSPEYMSPEQALGLDDIDARTDVWSVSVAMYEMLTGRVPFSKPNYNALMHAIINEEPDPSTKHAEGDSSLWEVLRKGLEKDRAHRWANMTELGEALALWLYQHGIKEDICGNSIRAVWLDPQIFSADSESTDFDSTRLVHLVLSDRPHLAGLRRRAAISTGPHSADANWAKPAWWRTGRVPRATLAVGAVALLLGLVGGRLANGDDEVNEPVASIVANADPTGQFAPLVMRPTPGPNPAAPELATGESGASTAGAVSNASGPTLAEPNVAGREPQPRNAAGAAARGSKPLSAASAAPERRRSSNNVRRKAKLDHDFGF